MYFMISKEALNYLKIAKFPFVAKTNIGASGSGVCIIRKQSDGQKYIEETFMGKGSPQRTGPNLDKGGLLKRGFHYVLHPSDIEKKLDIYQTKSINLQKGL